MDLTPSPAAAAVAPPASPAALAIRAFTWVTGLTFVIHSEHPVLLSAVPVENRNRHALPVCVAAKSRRFARCVEHCTRRMHQAATAAGTPSSGQPVLGACHAGMAEWVVAIRHAGHDLGFLFVSGVAATTDLPVAIDGRCSLPFLAPAARLQHLDPQEVPLISELTAQLAARLGQCAIAASRPATRAQRTDGLPALSSDAIRSWLFQNHADATLATLARFLQRSPDRARHIVKERFGQTFRQLLGDVRRQVAERVRQEGATMSEAARLAGWKDATSLRAHRRKRPVV